MRISRASLLFATVCVTAATASAVDTPGIEASGAMDGDEPRVHARLLVDLDLEEGATRGSVGVLFDLDPGWHLYWRNPGDSGLAPELDFGFDGGDAEAGEIAWPAPRAFEEDVDIVTYGYEGRVLLAAPVQYVASAPPRSVRVDARVLVCAESCIPASLVLQRAFATPDAERESVRASFESAASRMPPAAREHGVDVSLVEFERSGERVTGALQVEACGRSRDTCPLGALPTARASFFPAPPFVSRCRAKAAAPGTRRVRRSCSAGSSR
jgi:thiol:disulfide interchange protein DsbD